MRGIILGIRIYEWEKDFYGLQKIVNLNNDKIHEKLEKECEVALNQIDEKGYSSVLKNAGIEKVLKIGIAFLGKEFEVKFEK